MLARRYDEAIAQLRSTLTLDNNFAYAHQNLGLTLFLKGNIEGAIAEYEKAQRLNDSCDILALLVSAYAGLGRKTDALQTFDKFEQCAQHHTVRNHVYALAYVGIGDNEAAISYLEKSPENWLRIDPLLDPLRSNRRFQKLTAKWFVQK
jgi:adenylate cyclase